MAYVKKITTDQFIRDVIDFELKPYGINFEYILNLPKEPKNKDEIDPNIEYQDKWFSRYKFKTFDEFNAFRKYFYERWKDYSKLKTLVKFVSFPRTKESSTEIREIFSSAGVVLNPDAKIAAAVEKGVLRKNAYCPCRLQKLPEFFCPCEEFKSQLLDPSFKGFCHCRLYMKP